MVPRAEGSGSFSVGGRFRRATALTVISYQLSVISYRLSVISYRLSVIGYSLFVHGSVQAPRSDTLTGNTGQPPEKVPAGTAEKLQPGRSVAPPEFDDIVDHNHPHLTMWAAFCRGSAAYCLVIGDLHFRGSAA